MRSEFMEKLLLLIVCGVVATPIWELIQPEPGFVKSYRENFGRAPRLRNSQQTRNQCPALAAVSIVIHAEGRAQSLLFEPNLAPVGQRDDDDAEKRDDRRAADEVNARKLDDKRGSLTPTLVSLGHSLPD